MTDVAAANAQARQVDREHQRIATDCGRTLQQLAHDAAVAQHVELEPEWCLRGGTHFFQGANGGRTQGEGNASSLGGSRSLDLTAAAQGTAQPDRCQRQGHVGRATKELGSHMHLGHVT